MNGAGVAGVADPGPKIESAVPAIGVDDPDYNDSTPR